MLIAFDVGEMMLLCNVDVPPIVAGPTLSGVVSGSHSQMLSEAVYCLAQQVYDQPLVCALWVD